jgi:hypothetical protein
MIRHDYSNIQAVTLAAFNEHTELGQLIAQVYKDKEQLLLNRIIEIAKKYFHVSLLNEKNIEKLFLNLKAKRPCVSLY